MFYYIPPGDRPRNSSCTRTTVCKPVKVFIVVPCMLFQSLLYCSNSCTSLHFKTLTSHTKTVKLRPYMFRSPLKPSSGGPSPYFARLLNWNVDLHFFIKSVGMWLYVNSFRLCVCVGTYLVETVSFSILKCSEVYKLEP